MTQIDLGRKAMLVSLHISQWYNKRVDKLGVQTVKDNLNVENLGDVYVKRLIPQVYMQPIETLCGMIRTKHYEMTLPWLDNGLRILPGVSYFEYVDNINKLKLQLDAAVTHLCNSFPSLMENAKATKGALFREADYPNVSDLRNMFRVDVAFFPFPDQKDFRVELDEETLKELASKSQQMYIGMTERAVSDLRTSLSECLSKVLIMLKDQKIKSNSLDRLAVTAELATKLNITNDARLLELVETALQILEYHADMYKESDALRAQAIKTLELGL